MWSMSRVGGRALVDRLSGEADLLATHSSTWVRRLPPLLREAATRVADLEGTLILKQDQVVDLLDAVCTSEKRVEVDEARILVLESEIKKLRADSEELALVREGLLLIQAALIQGWE